MVVNRHAVMVMVTALVVVLVAGDVEEPDELEVDEIDKAVP